MKSTRPLGGGALFALLVAGAVACGSSSASPQHPRSSLAPPVAVQTIRSAVTLTVPVLESKTLLQLVSNPLIIQRAYQGRVSAVRSWVNSDDMADSEVHLTLADGSDVSYRMAGGTVRTRDVKALMNPPIGEAPSTEEELNAPVSMVLEDGAVPTVGQDVAVFLSYNKQSGVWKGGLTLVVTQTPSGPTYAFTSEPEMPWKPPASEAELNQLIAAVHAS